MTVALYDRVRETSTTTGTSIVVLAGAVAGFRAFAEVLTLSDRFYYLIENRAAPGEWEIGEGYLSGLGNTLNRERVLASSNSGALVNFSAGTKDVRLPLPSQALRQMQYASDSALINGGFSIFQRQAPATPTARTDGQYGPDRWYVLTQTAAINCERVAGGTASPYAVKLTQHQATAQRFGLAQVIEAANCRHLRGQNVILQGIAKASAAQAHRVALVEGTGTADAPVRDIVNNWASGTFTAGNFFLGSNLTIASVGSFTPAAGTRTGFELRGAVSANCNNLYVFIWTEGTAAQNFTLELEQCGLYLGTERRLWTPRMLGEEIAQCQRYFWKNLPTETAAVDGATALSVAGSCWATDNVTYNHPFPHEMRATPTITLYRSSTGSGAGKWSYINNSGAFADVTGSTPSASASGVSINFTGTMTAGRAYALNGVLTADAEFA